MFKFIRRTIFAGILLISLTLNAALVVSEVAYNIAYGLISNAASILYDASELTHSIGRKNAKLTRSLNKLDKELSQSTDALKKQSDDIVYLKNDRDKLRTLSEKLSDDVVKNKNEVDALKRSNNLKQKEIQSKISELNVLDRQLTDTKNRLSNADSNLSELTEKNKLLKTDHDLSKQNIAKLKSDLDDNKIAKDQLQEVVSKQKKTVAKLTKSTSVQLAQLVNTKKIIRETTDRTSKRIAKRVARNIAAMPFESVPVAGIAITVGTIYLEIQDACQSVKEFDEMKLSLGLDPENTETDQSYCALTKDDLIRLITNRTSDFEICVSQNGISKKAEINELMDCLPQKIDKLSLPDFDKFNKPAEAGL
jgi:predicted  nucleic acid-binding Zn-ribbon protein